MLFSTREFQEFRTRVNTLSVPVLIFLVSVIAKCLPQSLNLDRVFWILRSYLGHHKTVLFLASPDQCKLPIERGSCAGSFNRWGFNVNSGRCEQFIWGGCEGNGNRFGSEAACIHKCDPPGALKRTYWDCLGSKLNCLSICPGTVDR